MSTRFQFTLGQEYDLFKKACPHFDTLQAKLAETIQDYTNIFPEKKNFSVLEIGCGTGYTTWKICDADPRIIVTSVDNEPEMTKQAGINLHNKIKNGRVTIQQADALMFIKTLPNQSIDIFASAFTLHNFNHKYRSKVLAEIHRTLKRNGLFVNADKYAWDNPQRHQATLKWQLQQFKTIFRALDREDLEKEWTQHYLEDNHKDVIMRQEESIREMKKLGFNSIEVCYREKMEAVIKAKN